MFDYQVTVIINFPEDNYLNLLLKDIKVTRDNYWLLEDKNLTIDNSRNLSFWLKNKPNQVDDIKVALIPLWSAGLEAQNALLKTLEELPNYARVIIITPKLDLLLPTIVSRGQVIHSNNQEKNNLANVFLSSCLTDRLKIIKDLKEESEIQNLLSGIEFILSDYQKSKKITKDLESFLILKNSLKFRGVSNKLVFENMALILPVLD